MYAVITACHGLSLSIYTTAPCTLSALTFSNYKSVQLNLASLRITARRLFATMSTEGKLYGLNTFGKFYEPPHFVSEQHATRVAAGLKAAIHNPNVSEEARERAAERLESMEGGNGDQHQNRQLGGYKATLHSE